MRICLYQPDIAQNTGTILRTAACLGLGVDIIEPCGFVFSDAKFRRAGMDYLHQVDILRHSSWENFLATRKKSRLILLTTRSTQSVFDFVFEESDTLVFGRESAGVPDAIHQACDARLTIPMAENMRSLNVAVACGLVAGVALGCLGGKAG